MQFFFQILLLFFFKALPQLISGTCSMQNIAPACKHTFLVYQLHKLEVLNDNVMKG